jgi:hypothetical protein
VTARVQAGMPEPVARFTADWFQAIAAGEFAAPGDIEALTGRPPTPLATFLAGGAPVSLALAPCAKTVVMAALFEHGVMGSASCASQVPSTPYAPASKAH